MPARSFNQNLDFCVIPRLLVQFWTKWDALKQIPTITRLKITCPKRSDSQEC